jgi:hypothetical protein
MRRFLGLIAVAALVLGTASTTQAKIVDWSGTLIVDINFGTLVTTGTGVATTNGTGGANDHVNTIHFGPNNILGSTTFPITDPEQATLISIIGSGIVLPSTRNLGAQTGTTISPRVMALGGGFKVCILFPGCGIYLPFPIAFPINATGGTASPFTKGLGLGGIVTVNGFSQGPGLKISFAFNPWTLGVKQITDVSTTTGVTNGTVTLQGFKHGPASGTSSAAAESGVIQWVTPSRVLTTENPPDAKVAVFGVLTLRFIPEPGMLLLLASSVGGLVLLGRSRMRG